MSSRPGDAGRGLGRLSAPEVAEALGLEPHQEGGFFRETYRAAATVQTAAGPRSLATSVLYLLTADSPSRFHRLASDELWLYHAGAPAELILLRPGTTEYHIVGCDVPQVVVPARSWMAARVLGEEETDWGEGRAPERRWTPDRRRTPSPSWTLVSCVVAPGFEYEDLELGDREALLREFPQARGEILALT